MDVAEGGMTQERPFSNHCLTSVDEQLLDYEERYHLSIPRLLYAGVPTRVSMTHIDQKSNLPLQTFPSIFGEQHHARILASHM